MEHRPSLRKELPVFLADSASGLPRERFVDVLLCFGPFRVVPMNVNRTKEWQHSKSSVRAMTLIMANLTKAGCAPFVKAIRSFPTTPESGRNLGLSSPPNRASIGCRRRSERGLQLASVGVRGKRGNRPARVAVRKRRRRQRGAPSPTACGRSRVVGPACGATIKIDWPRGVAPLQLHT